MSVIEKGDLELAFKEFEALASEQGMEQQLKFLDDHPWFHMLPTQIIGLSERHDDWNPVARALIRRVPPTDLTALLMSKYRIYAWTRLSGDGYTCDWSEIVPWVLVHGTRFQTVAVIGELGPGLLQYVTEDDLLGTHMLKYILELAYMRETDDLSVWKTSAEEVGWERIVKFLTPPHQDP